MDEKDKKDFTFVGIVCLIAVLFNVLCVILKDLLPQIVINSFDDYKDNGIIDGFAGSTLVFPISIIILIASIVGIIMIIKGKNRIIRTFGIVTIVALCIFMPICNVHRSGGIAGIVENKDCSLVICYNKSN